jgi:hypothetical protein
MEKTFAEKLENTPQHFSFGKVPRCTKKNHPARHRRRLRANDITDSCWPYFCHFDPRKPPNFERFLLYHTFPSLASTIPCPDNSAASEVYPPKVRLPDSLG